MGQSLSQRDLILQRQDWKGNGQTVVFVSGCFDLLHPGHVRLLEQARSYGDKLVVGVQSDAGVKASQAEAVVKDSAEAIAARPITPGSERAEILAGLAAVDYVVEFDEPHATELIEALRPEIVVEGTPAEVATPPKETSASATSVEHSKVMRILREPGYSTEYLLTRIAQRPA